MFDRTGFYLIIAIVIGMVLGVVSVALFGEAMLNVKFLGDLFLNALKMVVIPLLFCSMIVGISNLGDVRKLGRTGLKTLGYFLATSTVSVIIGLVLVNIIQPGSDVPLSGAVAPEAIGHQSSYSFFTWLTSQIPSNIISAAAETKVLPIIIFALIFGGILTTIGSKGRPVIALFEGINEAIMKIVHLIMWFAPIGIFGLVAGQLADPEVGMGKFGEIFAGLGWYIVVVVIGLIIHGVVVLPLALKFLAGKSPFDYFVGMSQALMTAFATASSSATLPVTMNCVESKNDVDKRASSFVLPLGATINMDGTALYEAVAALFIAQAYASAGLFEITLFTQITICATAVLASVGAAGIPQAGLVTMVLVLTAVGLPLEGIGMILAVDWILDRCRTTVNVWGDSIGAAVIATTAEIGLVDRRRRTTTVRKSTDSREKEYGRRDDSRDKKKKTDYSRKAKDQKTRKSPTRSVSSINETKRTTRTKKTDKPKTTRKPVAQKPVKRVHRVESAPIAVHKEEYRPQKTEEKQTESVSTTATGNYYNIGGRLIPKSGESNNTAKNIDEKNAVRVGKVKKKPTARLEKTDSRKKTTPRGRKKVAKITEKAVSEAKVSDDTITQSESAPEFPRSFEIPKFPASILEELKTERISTDMQEASSSLEDIVPEKKNAEQPSPTKAKIEESERQDSKDFSRLDKAVLGDEKSKPEESYDASSRESKTDSSEITATIPESSPPGDLSISAGLPAQSISKKTEEVENASVEKKSDSTGNDGLRDSSNEKESSSIGFSLPDMATPSGIDPKTAKHDETNTATAKPEPDVEETNNSDKQDTVEKTDTSEKTEETPPVQWGRNRQKRH